MVYSFLTKALTEERKGKREKRSSTRSSKFFCVIIFKEIVAYKVGKSRCIRRWEKAESPTVPRQALLTLMKRSVKDMPMKIKASKTTMEEAQVTAQRKRVRKKLDLILDPSYQGFGGHLIFIFALFMPFNDLEDKRVSFNYPYLSSIPAELCRKIIFTASSGTDFTFLGVQEQHLNWFFN